MSPLLFAATALAGGLGATTRFWLDAVIKSRVSSALPWGTILINLTGSLLLGLLTGFVAAHALPAPWQSVAGTGFLGGYTTFSTASYETVRLLQRRQWGAAAVSGLGVVVLGSLLAGLGLWLGGLSGTA